MYKEEKVLQDGCLYWRSTPRGPWIKYTQKQLTSMLMETKEQVHNMSWALTPEHQRR